MPRCAAAQVTPDRGHPAAGAIQQRRSRRRSKPLLPQSPAPDDGNLLGRRGRGGPGPGNGRRDLRRDARRPSATMRQRPKVVKRRSMAKAYRGRAGTGGAYRTRMGEVSRQARPQAEDHGGQARPGWARPRRQGDRLGLRRYRLRRAGWPAVPDARRGGRAWRSPAKVHVVGVSSLAAGHKTPAASA